MNQSITSRSLKRARISVYALALTLAAGAGFAAKSGALGQQPKSTVPPASSTGSLASPVELSRVFINVAKQVKPAVVHINVVEKPRQSARFENDGFPQIPGLPPFGQMRPQPRRGAGSGVIISPDGYILTNNHVAGDASEIKVKLSDGREAKARLIGADPETDLALIKVEEQKLPYVKLGDSSKLEQGEWVIALGSPFGLEQTMTAGIVSATSRDLRAGPYDNYIQTDASINPGNSGGPLVNMQGEVIGINTMIFSRSGGSEGIGFAIPSNLASKIYTQLAKNGKVTRGYLGVNLQQITPALAKASGVEGVEGALVGDVADASSPAAKAGLRSGDVIVEFNGKQVKSPKQLTELVADTPVGENVPVKYLRDGRIGTTSIKLGERPGRRDAANRETENEAHGTSKLGITVTTVTPEIASELKLKVNSGAAIENVQPGSPADDAGLRRGDVIHRINRTPVMTAQDLTGALRSLKGEKEVVLQIERGSQLAFVTVILEE
ncbi:MAG: DegQ family serine endoprotease [Acidobacteria bacterium]|nr:DegQ family serine endoprotease [Acidobacteriota bacterium]